MARYCTPVLLIFVILVGVLRNTAHTEPFQTVSLRYVRMPGTEHCPDEDALKNQVSSLLTVSPWDDDGTRTLLVVLGRELRRFTAHLELRDRSGTILGTRALHSTQRTCDELATALRLAISLAIDPLGQHRVGTPVTQEPPRQPPEPASNKTIPQNTDDTETDPPSDSSKPSPSEPERQFAFAVGTYGAFVAGVVPRATPGIGLESFLSWRNLSLSLGARYVASAQKTVANPGAVAASSVLGIASPCVHYWYVAGCAVAAMGAVFAQGKNLLNAQNITTSYLFLGGRMMMELPVTSRFHVRFFADVLGTVSGVALRETGTSRIYWQTPKGTGAFGVGIWWYYFSV